MPERSAPARITLALDIVKKITDGPRKGFHELRIIKQQIDLCDIIHLQKSPGMKIVCDHPEVPVDAGNICWKAIELVKSEFGISDNARIEIEKRIPVRGGLAGGSSDAATTLMLANELWGLGLSTSRICSLGIRLGMDVPYFFFGKTAFDTEATGVLEPLDGNISFCFVLVFPETGVATAGAYASLDYSHTGKMGHLSDAMKAAFA
ncbi:MAG: hypothetical protein GF350_12425, partial [Chitinivibrionales bacterium]|nr:hypothetical protein [Chitinivibrionales bacterium]